MADSGVEIASQRDSQAPGAVTPASEQGAYFWMTQPNTSALEVDYQVGDIRTEPPLRLAPVWDLLDRFFVALKRLFHGVVPTEFNPFTQLGAIANVSFVVALVTGILLLFGYVPSLAGAHASLESMTGLSQLMRSLHRYSSDVCMLFALLHGLQILGSRRVGGARWLAWVTGCLLVGTLWFIGWTGYWLVWDDRALAIARESARMLDVLPIFSEPLSTTFLTPSTMKSLLFFLIFFLHMLLPLGFGVLLWIHLARLSRSHFLTRRGMTLAVIASLVLFSLCFPAHSSSAAKIQAVPKGFPLDLFYMWPLALMERLSEGVLWGLWWLGGVVLLGLPWALVRRSSPVATVVEPRCNACETCFNDCPFGAIQMVHREGENPKYPLVSRVDPDRCVGCGICVGSCDSAGIGFDALDPLGARKKIDQWLDGWDEQSPPTVAFLCSQSGAQQLQVSMDTGRSPALPGYLVLPVPCTGWVHTLLIERSIRRGARGVLLCSCGPDPVCREGEEWTRQRLAGERGDGLRREKLGGAPVELLQFDRSDPRGFVAAAQAFHQGQQPEDPQKFRSATPAKVLALLAVLAALVLVLFGGSLFPYQTPAPEKATLTLSIKHLGAFLSKKQSASHEKGLLPHMRGGVLTRRRRAPVRIRVHVDGELVLRASIPPQGVHGDGYSIAVHRLQLTPGNHRVKVEIGETADAKEWTHHSTKQLRFSKRWRHTLRFTRFGGFQWH